MQASFKNKPFFS